MKKTGVQLLFLFCFGSLCSQNPTYQQKLFYTCKVWGFVKYYHSEVSTCQVNWDSVLIADLPLVKNAITKDDFNDALDTILNAAGPMQIASTALPDTIAPELKRNRDWSWISDTMLRADVRVQLDTIKNNFRPHSICWVRENTPYDANYGYLIFPHDDTLLHQNITAGFPNEWKRITSFFAYWNIIRYFNPYNYVLDNSPDSILFNHVMDFVNASNPTQFYYACERVWTEIDDAHCEGLSWSSQLTYPALYKPKILLKHIPGKFIVSKTSFSSVGLGDELTAIDGISVPQWLDSLRRYISSGDSSVFYRFACDYLMTGPASSNVSLTFIDSTNISHTMIMTRNTSRVSYWFTSYFANDTLANTDWTQFGCGVGYVNMGKIMPSEIGNMYAALRQDPYIIFDLRDYPNATGPSLATYMYPQSTIFSKFILPDLTYPGTYTWYYDAYGFNGNSSPYAGTPIVLMNEVTQSQAEFTVMLLEGLPNTIKVGSQTAGADGDVTWFNWSNDIHTGFTSLGVFYPNGDSTQRIGIVPDSLVYPTQAGIRHHRDEVLEKALEIAQCWTSVHETPAVETSLSVFPNPASNDLTVQANQMEGNEVTILVTDITGRVMYSKTEPLVNGKLSTNIDLSSYSTGIYFIHVKDDAATYSIKVVKE